MKEIVEPSFSHPNYKILIVENQYFANVNAFKMFPNASNIYFEQYEKFQKMSFRNRCIISGSNGLINLTVPIKNGREIKDQIRDIKIDNDQRWVQQHWRAIESSYRRAPFFEYFSDELKMLLFKNHSYLFDLNSILNEWLFKKLAIKTPIQLTTEYCKHYDEELYLDIRNRWLPKNFMDDDNNPPIKYLQVFEEKFGFISNLSILDLLFCKGRL